MWQACRQSSSQHAVKRAALVPSPQQLTFTCELRFTHKSKFRDVACTHDKWQRWDLNWTISPIPYFNVPLPQPLACLIPALLGPVHSWNNQLSQWSSELRVIMSPYPNSDKLIPPGASGSHMQTEESLYADIAHAACDSLKYL